MSGSRTATLTLGCADQALARVSARVKQTSRVHILVARPPPEQPEAEWSALCFVQYARPNMSYLVFFLSFEERILLGD